MNVITRLAGREDFEHLGHLRWCFDHEGEERSDQDARPQFIADFVERQDDDLIHWLADANGKAVAVMSVRKVKKVPKLGALDGYWGHLTNSYVLPDYRNQGSQAASRMLRAGAGRRHPDGTPKAAER